MAGKNAPVGKVPSRIVVEFEGPGSANIVQTQFTNVSPGQIYEWAKIAELQAQSVFVQVQIEAQQRQPQIVVPRGPITPA